MIDLLIPSAKIVGTNLPNFKSLPPIIYPINQEIVFDFLYNQYKNEVSTINIICYEEAQKVYDALKKYEVENVKIDVLDKLGNLGETVYYGLNSCNSDEVIINFADTIVDEKILNTEGDCFWYSEDYKSDVWTFFEENNGKITKIMDKDESDLERCTKIICWCL